QRTMKDTTKKTVPTGSTSKRKHSTKNNETIANNKNSAILSQANSQIPPISLTRSNLHTPPTSFPTSSIPLSDTTVRTQTQQEVLTPTFESSKSRLTAKEKGKGKAVASGKKKTKTVHATETEGVGLHGDGYSSEENDESIYHDYEGAYEVEGEQHYDCSSEESDTESESNVNFDIMSKESDTVGPSKRKTSSKGKNSWLNFYFLSLIRFIDCACL
ncbi:hypothetical protein HID58_042531, partial [Brassica napus]